MFRKIRKYIYIIVALTILALGISLAVSVDANQKLKTKYEEVLSNQTGYIRDLASAANDIHMYQLTIEDLRYMNDSVSRKMTELQEKLRIKDKRIQNLQYMASQFKKTDTLRFTDTVFYREDFCVDTTVGDKWMSVRLGLEYPNIISVSATAASEKTVAIYSKRETIKPPKKTWIGRLFQRKHRVTKVYIDEANPYIISQQNQFVEITTGNGRKKNR